MLQEDRSPTNVHEIISNIPRPSVTLLHELKVLLGAEHDPVCKQQAESEQERGIAGSLIIEKFLECDGSSTEAVIKTAKEIFELFNSSYRPLPTADGNTQCERPSEAPYSSSYIRSGVQIFEIQAFVSTFAYLCDRNIDLKSFFSEELLTSDDSYGCKNITARMLSECNTVDTQVAITAFNLLLSSFTSGDHQHIGQAELSNLVIKMDSFSAENAEKFLAVANQFSEDTATSENYIFVGYRVLVARFSKRFPDVFRSAALKATHSVESSNILRSVANFSLQQSL